MLGIKHLPEELKHSYSKALPPRYVKHIGLSQTPWFSPGLEVLQPLFDEIYPDYTVVLTGKEAATDVVSLILILDINGLPDMLRPRQSAKLQTGGAW